MRSLLLTLGHNSSAALVEGGRVKWGYETERVSGSKSDSRFPQAVLDYTKCRKPEIAYVSHWAPDGSVRSMSEKHWRPDLLEGVPIRSVDPSFTHHDAHMFGAICYAGHDFLWGSRPIGVVVDGFGTMGEHFSVYDLTEHRRPRLLERTHGYGTSLGLWYQYATAFMGMKMHEDEYKLLGYEAHVHLSTAERMAPLIRAAATEWVDQMDRSIYGSKFDPLYNLTALAEIKNEVFSHLTGVCGQLEVRDPTSHEGRIVLAHYVQGVLERVVKERVLQHRPTSLLLSGGVFYNVKLNKVLIDAVAPGKVCVYPLAGDQGCAIGLYAKDHPEFVFPDDLAWGTRVLKDVGQVDGLYYADDEVDAADFISSRLVDVGYVNLVRGAMEFGPRALCNTSTLAVPTMENVRAINAANERNTVMPMAPVMTPHMYHELFENAEAVHRSQAHMIVALEYAEHPLPKRMGIAHGYEYPYRHHTGRPQVLSKHDSMMTSLVNEFGPLINTSFNFHGMPIALDMPSVVKNHIMQYGRDRNFATVVVKNDQ